RAMEAAQQAISSPLLDNVSIAGATGVLINITGGNDLTLGEASTINQIIHDAAGDDAEIIFGAHNDPAMQGEVRVTVIATGFDRAMSHDAGRSAPGILPFPTPRRAATPAPLSAPAPAARTEPRRASSSSEVPDMEIPTFIRRQMD
ncbi:MAG TPA: cell division protein FtsZ, partial [Gemmatimonadales bacterium]|nr:cell division protein FtsZ [Gemmatimonadales bacterium]